MRLSLAVVFASIIAVALLFCPSPGYSGEADKSEKVHFVTVDGVKIYGNWYQGKNNGPVVMMLHAIGQDSRKKGWAELAMDLQKNGYSVLTFDFRGHGNSTEVQSDVFFKVPTNKSMVKATSKKGTIEYKDFTLAYYPVLVNDIAAAKGFIDRKNDNKNCNSASTIVIGSETGATLGAIWLNSEWYLHKLTEVPTNNPFQPTIWQPDPQAEGKDVIAAVWLSLSTKLGSRNVRVTGILDVAARVNSTPMLFVYGDGDTTGRDIAKGVVKAIKTTGGKGKFQYTDAVEVGKNAKLTGVDLLQPSLKASDEIIHRLTDIVGDKGNDEWRPKDFRSTKYVWLVPGQPFTVQVQAKMNASESTLLFNSYEQYIVAK